MAFVRKASPARRIDLIPLMDMAFILLVFFAINMYSQAGERSEVRVSIVVPELSVSKVQVLVQIVSPDLVYWWDSTAVGAVEQAFARGRSPSNVLFTRKYRKTMQQALDRFLAVVSAANASPGEEFQILVRCPGDVPYEVPLKFVQLASLTKWGNVRVGLVGGSSEELRQSSFRRVRLAGGRRALRIDF